VHFVNDLIDEMRLTEFDVSLWHMFHIDTQLIGDTALIFHIKSLFQFLNCLINCFLWWCCKDAVVDVYNEYHIIAEEYALIHYQLFESNFGKSFC
jgi:hypothetical protein